MKKIVFSGGGTLGHILPNIVVANKLVKNGYLVYYIGEKDSMEEKLANQNNIPFYSIRAVKLDRYRKINNLKIPYLLPEAINDAKNVITKIQPDLVFTKGGYVSLPVVIASKMLKIPQFCHESDCSLGIVNKIAYRLGAKVLTSENCNFSNGTKVGIPLKPELFEKKSKILSTKPTILVTGGSQGAKYINDFILENSGEILQKYNLIIIGGKTIDKSIKKDGLEIVDFTTKMQDYYSRADIVICRAGATTIAEIIALNKKAILVPLPLTVSRGDQLQNAKMVERDTIKIINQEDLEIKTLLERLAKLQKTPVKEKTFVNPLDTVYKLIVQKIEN